MSETFPIVEIDEETLDVLKLFQDVLKITNSFFQEGSKEDRRGHLNSLRDLKKIKQELSRFHNYPFINTIMKQIENLNSEATEWLQSKRENKQLTIPSLANDIARAKAAWKTGDREAVKAASKMLIKKMDVSTIAKQSEKEVLRKYKNPFYIENPLIFQTNDFLKVFEKQDMDEVITKDLTKFKYSYLKLPASRHSDFQFIAYFILQLRDAPGEIELSSHQINKYFEMAYSNEAYASLTRMVKRYLSSNDKSLIPEIAEKLKEFPDIIKANKMALSKIDTVYRGVAFSDEDDEDDDAVFDAETVIANDAKKSFLATSKFESVAERFALRIGHLESRSAARSSGVVVEYSVDMDSLVLDTNIFGGIFGEDEIIMNPRKAVVNKYTLVGPDVEDDDYDDDDN